MSRTHASMVRPILLGVVLIVTAGARSAPWPESATSDVPDARPSSSPSPRPAGSIRSTATAWGRSSRTPAVVVQGNYPIGGGYSPLGTYGDRRMSLYRSAFELPDGDGPRPDVRAGL